MQTFIWCRTTFTGFHFWPDAPPEVMYLRSNHRHIFHVEVQVDVSQLDREVEFHILKKNVDASIVSFDMFTHYTAKPFSCESIADRLFKLLAAKNFKVRQVTVSEDGENGATVCL